MFDEDGKVKKLKVHFNPDDMKPNPPCFHEPLPDYSREFDPRENPVFIQHALLNKGEYPKEYTPLYERFIEDTNARETSSTKIHKKLLQWYQIYQGPFDRDNSPGKHHYNTGEKTE